MRDVKAVALFSGGLDSILACRIIAAQGIRVRALKFITPFFDHHLLDEEEAYRKRVRSRFGVDVRLVDLSRGYMELLRNPAHGFGKHFNPCIDCKILMLQRAREVMAAWGGSFLISGEVLGQRPMSQRRDTLRVIERDSGCEDILLRPLSARLLKPTLPEREGLVDRSRLYDCAGRGRKTQIRLAAEFGITGYPNPAGGCILTDPNLATRIERFYNGLFRGETADFRVSDIKLLLLGRQFCLPGGNWFVLGRNKKENLAIERLREPGDWLFRMTDRPGPTGLFRRAEQRLAKSDRSSDLLEMAAGLVVRYGKKVNGQRMPAQVRIDRDVPCILEASPLSDSIFRPWQV